MRFQEEMKATYTVPTVMSNSGSYDAIADQVLACLKRRIQVQMGNMPRTNVTGHANLEGFQSLAHCVGCLLVEGVHPAGLFRQTLDVRLTEKGRCLIRNLTEMASRDGIDVAFTLDYQGNRIPLTEEDLTGRFQLPHTGRLTESSPKVRVDYAFQAA